MLVRYQNFVEFRFDEPVRVKKNEILYFGARDRQQWFGFSRGLRQGDKFDNEYFTLTAGMECDRSGSDIEFLNGRMHPGRFWKLPVGKITIDVCFDFCSLLYQIYPVCDSLISFQIGMKHGGCG